MNKLKQFYKEQEEKLAAVAAAVVAVDVDDANKNKIKKTKKSKYVKNKKDGIVYCSMILSEKKEIIGYDEENDDLKFIFESMKVEKKKRQKKRNKKEENQMTTTTTTTTTTKWDDYADCFLQGWWYIVSREEKK